MRPNPYLAQWQVQIVVYNQYIVGFEVMLAHQRTDCLAAFVHECLGFDQQNLLAIEIQTADESFGLSAGESHASFFCENIEYIEADIVARMRVCSAGIAQTDYDSHDLAFHTLSKISLMLHSE